MLKLREKVYYQISDVEDICSRILEEYANDYKKRDKISREFHKLLSEMEEILKYDALISDEMRFKMDVYLLIMEIFADKIRDDALKRKILKIILLKNRKRV